MELMLFDKQPENKKIEKFMVRPGSSYSFMSCQLVSTRKSRECTNLKSENFCQHFQLNTSLVIKGNTSANSSFINIAMY